MAELLILGSGTGMPYRKRATPGYLLSTKDKHILIDGGAGTLQRLIRRGVTYHDIDCILYSHLHPDHTLDLVSVLFAAKYPADLREKDLVIVGPKGIEDFYNRMLALYGATIKPESYRVIFKEMSDGELELGGLRITTKTLEHTNGGMGYRIELKGGAVLTYSGDTDYCDNIIKLAEGAKLLILECSFPDHLKAKGHLTPSLAGRVASEARCKRLVLTHLYPICDRYPILKQCRKEFKGKVILAKDGMSLKL